MLQHMLGRRLQEIMSFAFKKEGSIVALTTKMRLRIFGLVKERTDGLGFFPKKDK